MKISNFIFILFLTPILAIFEGDGTFYGNGGAGESGACMLKRGFNGIQTTVAINREQYNEGLSCGKCVMITGKGEGIGQTPIFGPILATIDNECPECKFGDIDMGLSGDGRWKITWDFVECHPKRHLRG